jgi:hypothetical protein
MTSQPTPEAIAALLRETFAEYDGDRMGFEVHKAAFTPDIVVELRGVDMLPFNPGEGPRALLDDYAAAIRKAGWPVRTPSGCVIVTAPPAASGEATGSKAKEADR